MEQFKKPPIKKQPDPDSLEHQKQEDPDQIKPQNNHLFPLYRTKA